MEEREARLAELEATLQRMEQRTTDLETQINETKGEADAKAAVIQSLEQAEDEWKTKVTQVSHGIEQTHTNEIREKQ